MKKYDDIIQLQHPDSKVHPRMSVYNRAAQFAPFAALTGYEDAIHETERLTNERILLDENKQEILDEKMQLLLRHIAERPEITITYFVPDEKKDGGRYLTLTGTVKKIDAYTQKVLLESGERIAIEDVIDLQGKLFDCI